MADNNLRSGRDPLVELARLIARGDPFVESASGDAYDAPGSSVTPVDCAAQEMGERYTASPPLAPSSSHAVQHGYKETSAGSRYFSWLAAQLNGVREEFTPNQRREAQLPLGHQLSTYATARAFETTPERSYETADEHRYHGKAYATNDDARRTDEDYTNGWSRYRRSSLVLLLAVLGLAMLGVAGAYGYRAIFKGPVPPTLAPIGKANKIAPVSAVLEAKSATNTDQAGTTTTGASENLISGKEQSVKPDPRVIRTIPITQDEGWLRGAAATTPGAIQMAPNEGMPGPVMSVWPPPAMAAPTAPRAAAPIPAPPLQVLSEPKKTHSGSSRADQSGAADARPEAPSPAAPVALGSPNSAAPMAPSVSGGGYAVQVTSERSESNAQAALQAVQVKYPNQLRGHQPIIRRVDLGAKGIYYRVLVSPFASVEEAAGLCSRLKAAGGHCIVQRN